jgi:hypothetical protein
MNIKKNLYLLIITFIVSCSPATQSSEDVAPDGYKMLLMGHSFFRPYAKTFDDMVSYTEIENHDATIVFRGGENGRPINLWNDSTTEEHQLIKSTLDQGNIELFGMTSEYDYYINEMIHKEIVDELRKEFPSTKIFTIPTGWATKNLAQMNLDNELLDDITTVGPKSTSIFTDEKGHQGQIVIETGTMIWLNSIYQINLEDFDYDTGFNTDLHQIAIDVMNNHPSSYKFYNE